MGVMYEEEIQDKLRIAMQRVRNLRFLKNARVISAYEERQAIDGIRAEFGLGPLETASHA